MADPRTISLTDDNAHQVNRVQLTIDLPSDVADVLAADGDALLLALAALVKKCRSFPSREIKEAAKKKRKENIATRLLYLTNLGRDGYRQQRKLGEAFSLTSTASDLGVQKSVLKVAIDRFKKSFRCKLKLRRNREVVRYAHRGFTNKQISLALGIHRNTVNKIVDAERHRMAQSSRLLRKPKSISNEGINS